LDDAIRECRRTIELDPSFGVAYGVMAGAYSAKGLFAQALASQEKAVELTGSNPITVAHLGHIRAAAGDSAGALRIAEQLEQAWREGRAPALAVAVVYAGLHDDAQAFAWLEKAYDERSNRLALLATEHAWDSLRADPRFDGLLRRMGLVKRPRRRRRST